MRPVHPLQADRRWPQLPGEVRYTATWFILNAIVIAYLGIITVAIHGNEYRTPVRPSSLHRRTTQPGRNRRTHDRPSLGFKFIRPNPARIKIFHPLFKGLTSKRHFRIVKCGKHLGGKRPKRRFCHHARAPFNFIVCSTERL